MKTLSIKGKQRGQGMTEYIIIVALIAVASIGVYSFFGTAVREQTAGLAREVSGQSAQTQITHAQAGANSAASSAAVNKSLNNYDDLNNQGAGGGPAAPAP